MFGKALELEVSSLFPIDLTEAAFTAHATDLDTIVVHLNSELANSTSAKSNKYVSRGSFPLPRVEAKGPFGWQCVHTNDENAHGSELEQFLHSTLAAIEGNQQLQSRAATLRRCEQDSNHKWWKLTSSILNVIFSDIGFKSINVTESSRYRAQGILSETQKARLYYALCAAPEGLVQKFLDGGYIEFRYKPSQQWIKSNTFHKKGSSIIFIPQKGDENTLEITSANFYTYLRCRGLLQHVLMGHREGTLVDLPWFASSPNFQPAAIDGYEFVSPFSIRSSARIENRLYPTAYSIVDYNSELATSFANSVLGFDIRCPSFVADYERLSRYPPITRARLAKDQSSIRPWTNLYERELRKKILRTGDTATSISLAKGPSFSSFGFRQILCAAAIELAKPSTNKSQDIEAIGTELIKNILDDRIISASSIVDLAEGQLTTLKAHFGSSITVNDLQVLTKNLSIMRDLKGDQNRDGEISGRFLSKSRAFFIDLGSIYYAWLSACVTGPLKAHLLVLWLMHGGEGLRDRFDDIIRRRLDRTLPPSLPFSINYFDERD